jgi:hypothetical protein
VLDYYSAAFFLTNPDLAGIRANPLAVRRLRFVGGGLHEQIVVANSAPEPVRFELRLSARADYADLFEVKSWVRDRSANLDTKHRPDTGVLHFHYQVQGSRPRPACRPCGAGSSSRPPSRRWSGTWRNPTWRPSGRAATSA